MHMKGVGRSEPALTSVAAAVTRGHGRPMNTRRGRLYSLGNQRDVGGAAATEEDGVNRNALGASQSRQMVGHCEAGTVKRRPRAAFAGLGVQSVVPVDQVRRNVTVDAFPPHVTVVAETFVKMEFACRSPWPWGWSAGGAGAMPKKPAWG